MSTMYRTFLSILLIFTASSCAVRQTSSVLTAEQESSRKKKVLLYVNDYRKSKNLSPLVSSEPLDRLARAHSSAMQRSNQMDHQGFSGRVAKVRKLYPRTYIAENIGFNYSLALPEKTMVDSWMSSQGHRANILGNYRYTGIGVTQNAEGKIFFTQIFVGQ